MDFTFSHLDSLRKNHPTWRFLTADSAPLMAAFFHRAYIESNRRGISQSELESLLEDYLFHVRDILGEAAFPRAARDYLDDWAQDDKGWLRKYYPSGSDEAHYDLSPGSEKALLWLEQLQKRQFVGTESRLLTIFDLLRQLVEGSDNDPETRIRQLEETKAQCDRDIARIRSGDIPLLDNAALKDRFQQFTSMARELLGDFREVEQNFRLLDRRVREKMALWSGSKGELLDSILGERDEISESDQGRSFQAFWDFLMSASRQEELESLLESIFQLQAIKESEPDPRFRRIHYDWLEAGEHTQRTVARLSQQLRRFLDDRVFLENQRIMQILRNIESKALELRENMDSFPSLAMEDFSPQIQAPMERSLFRPGLAIKLETQGAEEAPDEGNTQALFDLSLVDSAVLRNRIQGELQEKSQISLEELLESHPLEEGLAELLVYLDLASRTVPAVISEEQEDRITWTGRDGQIRTARVPRIIFVHRAEASAELETVSHSGSKSRSLSE